MGNTQQTTKKEREAAQVAQAPQGAAEPLGLEAAASQAMERATIGGATALAVVNDDAIAAAIESARELELSFEQFIPIDELQGMDVPLMITDAVTITIPNKGAKPGEPQEKPVHVFRFEVADGEAKGMEHFSMFGINGPRDRIAQAFAANRLIGRRITVGPVKLGQRETNFPNPAWIFVKQPGFDVRYH